MSVMLIVCPATKRYVNTGLDVNSAAARMTNGGGTVLCPHCGKYHRWTTREAVRALPFRWAEDPETENCFIKAQLAADRAAMARTIEDREFHEKMERKWLGLAEGFSMIAEIDRHNRLP